MAWSVPTHSEHRMRAKAAGQGTHPLDGFLVTLPDDVGSPEGFDQGDPVGMAAEEEDGFRA